jgi:hypothetical protein
VARAIKVFLECWWLWSATQSHFLCVALVPSLLNSICIKEKRSANAWKSTFLVGHYRFAHGWIELCKSCWPCQMHSSRVGRHGVWVWTPTLCLGLFQRGHRRFMQRHTIMFAWEQWGNPCGLDQAEKGSGKKAVMVLTIALMLAYSPLYIHLWPLSFRSTTSVWWQILPSSCPKSGWPNPTELKHDETELPYLVHMFCLYESCLWLNILSCLTRLQVPMCKSIMLIWASFC